MASATAFQSASEPARPSRGPVTAIRMSTSVPSNARDVRSLMTALLTVAFRRPVDAFLATAFQWSVTLDFLSSNGYGEAHALAHPAHEPAADAEPPPRRRLEEAQA